METEPILTNHIAPFPLCLRRIGCFCSICSLLCRLPVILLHMLGHLLCQGSRLLSLELRMTHQSPLCLRFAPKLLRRACSTRQASVRIRDAHLLLPVAGSTSHLKWVNRCSDRTDGCATYRVIDLLTLGGRLPRRRCDNGTLAGRPCAPTRCWLIITHVLILRPMLLIVFCLCISHICKWVSITTIPGLLNVLCDAPASPSPPSMPSAAGDSHHRCSGCIRSLTRGERSGTLNSSYPFMRFASPHFAATSERLIAS